MTWAKDLLREVEKQFPLSGVGRHALTYDVATDSLVLFLNDCGGFRPVGFTEEEFQRDPIEVVKEIKALVEQEQDKE